MLLASWPAFWGLSAEVGPTTLWAQPPAPDAQTSPQNSPQASSQVVPGASAAAEVFVTGRELQSRLERSVVVTLAAAGETLRGVCERLSQMQQIAIVLDRRLDPQGLVTASGPVTGTLPQVLQQLAQSQAATCIEVGGCLFVTPAETVGAFEAVREWQADQLRAAAEIASNAGRIKGMFERRAVVWPRLARPRELVQAACQQQGLRMSNPEEIPHDLWQHGRLPETHTCEFLCWVLFQYGQTFAWDGAGEVRIVPLPEAFELIRSYSFTSRQRAQLLPSLQQQFPDSRWTLQKGRWEVIGPWELHAQLKAELSGSARPATPRPAANTPSWQTQTFTMRVQRKPLGGVLDYLQQAGLPFAYDREQFQQAGIPLDGVISFEVNSSDLRGLLQALCEPAGLKFEIGPESIQLFPAEK